MGQWSIHFYQGGEKFRVSEQEDEFEKKKIIYGFHNWQLWAIVAWHFFSVQSGKLLKEENISIK